MVNVHVRQKSGWEELKPEAKFGIIDGVKAWLKRKIEKQDAENIELRSQDSRLLHVDCETIEWRVWPRCWRIGSKGTSLPPR